MDIEIGSQCKYDYLRVYDGGDTEAPLVKEYCGRFKPSQIVSTYNELFLTFYSDNQVVRKGFNVSWEFTSPATTRLPTTTTQAPTTIPRKISKTHTLTGGSGEIISANYPFSYEVNRDDYWNVRVQPHQYIRLKFHVTDVEGSSSCQKDYIMVRDGDHSAPVVGRYCGTSNPAVIESTTNKLNIHLHSDESTTGKGFRARWVALTRATQPATTVSTTPKPQEYHITLNKDTGVLTSNNYPGRYDHNTNYYWTVRTAADTTIRLNFDDMDVDSPHDCRTDYVQVKDGDSLKAPNLGKYCRTLIPQPIVTSSNVAYVHFHTDGSVARKGFKLRWSVIRKVTTTTAPPTTTTSPSCGETLKGEKGQIMSPSYPKKYPTNRDCRWKILGDAKEKIALSFLDIYIERGFDCKYDYLKIYDGADESAHLVGTYCGTSRPSDIVSTGAALYVHFRSDGQITRRGFRLAYRKMRPTLPPPTVPQREFKYTITGESGVVTSSRYPDNYPVKSDFYWSITAPQGKQIRAWFTELDIVSDDQCSQDYIRLYDGETASSTPLGTYCGQSIPQPVTTLNNRMFIHFRSDGFRTDKGFQLRWKAEDVKVTEKPPTEVVESFEKAVVGSEGKIKSPNFPSKYSLNKDYYWVITVPQSRKVQIELVELAIEESDNCAYDYIEFRDGANKDAPVIGRYCGTNIPARFASTGRQMLVHLHSDDQITKRGFYLRYRAVLFTKTTPKPYFGITTNEPAKKCSFAYTGERGEVTSPGFPNNYPKNAQCYWLIAVPEGRIVQLNFVEFNVEASGACSYDFLRVFDGSNDKAHQIDNYCGKIATGKVIQSTGNQLYLHFYSDDRQTRTGFQLRWEAVHAHLATPPPSIVETTPSNKHTLTPNTPATTKKPEKRCKFKVSGRSGTITHPNYPNNYLRNQDCVWYITSPAGTVIRAKIVEIDIESAGSCFYDYLLLRNGGKSNSPSLGRFCGDRRIPDVYSTGNRMFVQFYSDDRNTMGGFLIRWYAQKEGVRTTTTPLLTPTTTTTTTKTKLDEFGRPPVICGSTFTSVHSQFNHRDYPYSYRGDEHCLYKIRAPRNYRIVLYFSLFDIEASEGCTTDYLEITDANEYEPEEGNPTERHCGKKKPGTYRSRTNTVTMRFLTNDVFEYGGFVAHYAFELKPWLTTTKRSTQKPTERPTTQTVPTTQLVQTRPTEVTTDGRLTAYEEGRIVISVGDKKITGRITVDRNGRVVIIDDDESRSEGEVTTDQDGYIIIFLGGRYVRYGRVLSDSNGYIILTVNGNKTTIGRVTTDRNGRTYITRNNVTPGEITEGRIIIKTDDKESIAGRITTTDDGRVVMTTDGSNHNGDFKITTDKYGYIFITYGGRTIKYGRITTDRDGFIVIYANGQKTTIGRVKTGSDGRAIITVTGETDRVIEGGEVTRSSEGRITITTSDGQTITGRITLNRDGRVVMITDNRETNGQITTDRDGYIILIIGGQTITYGRIHTNRDGVVTLTVAGQKTRLGRVTRDSKGRTTLLLDGRSGRFTTDESGTITGGAITHKDSYREYAGDKGVVTHNGYPGNYKNNVRNVWLIIAPPDNRLRLTFDRLSLANSDGCVEDYVSVYDGPSESSRLLERRCQYTREPIMSSGRQVLIVFRTNDRGTAGGFRINWKAEPLQTSTARDSAVDICDNSQHVVELHKAKQIKLAAPTRQTFGEQQPVSCLRQFSVRPGQVLKVEWVRLELAEKTHRQCQNYVSVRDGSGFAAKELGRYCGNQLPQSVTTSSENLLVEYHYDPRLVEADHDFILTVTAVPRPRTASFYTEPFKCGDVIRGREGIVTSPRKENLSIGGLYWCVWQIQSTPGTQIELSFETLQIDCTRSHIIIRDGGSSTSRRLAKHCGGTRESLTTAGNRVWLEFKGSKFDNFIFKWKEISVRESQCGGLVTGLNGVLTSPYFPQSFDHVQNCFWNIMAPKGSTILLTLESVELGNDCSRSYVVVRDGMSSDAPLIGRYCSRDRRVITSSQNAMLVELQSGCHAQKRFRATWGALI